MPRGSPKKPVTVRLDPTLLERAQQLPGTKQSLSLWLRVDVKLTTAIAESLRLLLAAQQDQNNEIV